MRKIVILSLVLLIASSSVFASSGSVTPVKENPVQQPPITNIQQKPIKGLVILGDNYAVDSDFVYVVNSTRSGWVQIPNADRVTFKVLAGQFARDMDQIFQMGKKIDGALLNSFSVISGQHGYAQDDKRIYGPKGVIKEADPEKFKMLTKHYSLDAGHVFFDGMNIPEANSGSFRVIDNGLYAIDDKSVFYAGKLLKNAIPEGLIVK
jgi:DKNYY family